jgi:hypothetical protein
MGEKDEVTLVPSIKALGACIDREYQEVDRGKVLRLFQNIAPSSTLWIRRFVADAGLSRSVYVMDDHDVFALVCQAIRDGRLVGVQKATTKTQAPSETAERRRLVRKIESITQGRLHHSGRSYKLVADIDLAKVPGRNDYMVVPRVDAEGVLADIGGAPGVLPEVAAAFAQTREKLTQDWRPPLFPDGLVLLRRDVSRVAASPVQEPAITPSQMRALAEAEAAITMLQVPEFIASGAETVTIRYAFTDPRHRLTDAVLLIFSKKNEATPVWSRDIPAAHVADGRGSLDWNGSLDISPGGDFPDGFATLAGSPYLVRITAKDGGKELSCEAEIRVEVAEVKLEVAANCLTNVRDKEVAKRLTSLGKTQAIGLRVTEFFTGAIEKKIARRYDPDAKEPAPAVDFGHGSAFRQWGGLRLPLVATVLVHNSRSGRTVAGKAMGQARVLWDYIEPPPASRPNVTDDSNAYLHAVETYDSANAWPTNGRNTPVLLGGKRAAKRATTPVLDVPDKGIVDFPFKVIFPEKRFWAAFSEIEKSGAHEGSAGVVFRPSVISGDAYNVTAHVDVARALDTRDPIPEQTAHGDTGWLEMRREVPLVRFVRKCPEVEATLRDVGAFTAPAYLGCLNEIPDQCEVLDRASYYKLLDNALKEIIESKKRRPKSKNKLFDEFAMFPIDDQYDMEPSWWSRHVGDGARRPVKEMVRFRKYAEFVERCEVALKEPAYEKLKGELASWNAPKGNASYAQKVEDRATALASLIGKALATQPGITIASFAKLHNLEGSATITNGLAALQASEKSRATIMLFRDSPETLAHELGHCLFLPHAPSVSDAKLKIGGAIPSRHVPGTVRCLMAYGDSRPGFCAICLLRLRGADGEHLSPDGLVP